MPSGNATFTYSGPEPITVQGVRFEPGVPTQTGDNGLIEVLDNWGDEFKRATEAKAKKPAPKPAADAKKAGKKA